MLNGISLLLSHQLRGGRRRQRRTRAGRCHSTTDGGATWSMSADPALAGVQQVMSLSCLATSASPVCHATGFAPQVGGPVALTSLDGGGTRSVTPPFDTTGWLSTNSCADIQHCWAAGAGTTVALAGTTDSGLTWSTVTCNTSATTIAVCDS